MGLSTLSLEITHRLVGLKQRHYRRQSFNHFILQHLLIHTNIPTEIPISPLTHSRKAFQHNRIALQSRPSKMVSTSNLCRYIHATTYVISTYKSLLTAIAKQHVRVAETGQGFTSVSEWTNLDQFANSLEQILVTS